MSEPGPDERPWTFARLTPGAVLGTAVETVTDADVARFLALYAGEPDPRPRVPPGMVMLLVMRGYARAVTPRPPGNVHAAQSLTILRLPRVGDMLTTTVRCASAEERKGRRWVRLAVLAQDADGERCYRGVITSLWSR